LKAVQTGAEFFLFIEILLPVNLCWSETH